MWLAVLVHNWRLRLTKASSAARSDCGKALLFVLSSLHGFISNQEHVLETSGLTTAGEEAFWELQFWQESGRRRGRGRSGLEARDRGCRQARCGAPVVPARPPPRPWLHHSAPGPGVLFF